MKWSGEDSILSLTLDAWLVHESVGSNITPVYPPPSSLHYQLKWEDNLSASYDYHKTT